MTSTITTTERKPAAERIAVRCVDSDVHPVPRRGELGQYIPEPWVQAAPAILKFLDK